MPYIHSVECSLAPHYYDQDQLTDALMADWRERYFNPQRIIDFQRNVLVGGRHLAIPLEAYQELSGFGSFNTAWVKAAVPMATEAVAKVLDAAALDASDIDAIVSTTVTGLAVPSLDARLMNQLPFRRDTRRMPLFGLGCLAGVAGINRVGDYLDGHPDQAALLVSVELCSLTLQKQDLSVANIVASGLFGDGCAAVLMVGDEHPLAATAPLRWSNPRSAFFQDTERVMGWDVVDSGFKVVLSPDVPKIVAEELPSEVEALMADSGLEQARPDFLVAHPGGPKVMKAMETALGLDEDALALSWDSLARYGNMSSSSVLFVLRERMKNLPPAGSVGMMAAMGPAFCAELNLLETVH
ncbi:MAG: type III polyketide synthase [Myxococcota bacterium]|nr:type III polyketide synthase [Myxococcota bacterium]